MKTRIEVRKEGIDILSAIAEKMGINLAAAANALISKYGSHMLSTWEYKFAETQNSASFPTIAVDSNTPRPDLEPMNIAELMAPMEL